VVPKEAHLQTIKRLLRDYLRENFLLAGAVDELEDQTSLLSRGIMDSTSVLELVGFLEDHFKIEVADQEIVPENLDSLESIATYVRRKQQLAAPPA
jgi:acyl carrier protein